METARHELVTCMIDHAESALKRAGIEPQKAESIAVGMVDEIIDVFGGQSFVFPKEFARKQTKKEASIYADFNASASYRKLSVTHDMTERGLRKLINRVRDRIAQAAKT